MKKITGIILTIVMTLNLTACNLTEKDSAVSLTHFCLDTVVTITIYSHAGEEDAKDIINQCFGLCNHYEKLFSRTIADSDVSKINNSNGKPVEVNHVVAEVIENSLEYSRLSEGAFDVTVAPLSILWNFNGENTTVPIDKDIKDALIHVNYKNITIDEDFVTLSDSEAQIDLGGIAKGFIADKLKSYMISVGVTSAIIDLGGNILTIGSKPSNENFKIGIKQPFAENAQSYAATVNVSNKSIVTSGIYERFFENNDKIYHHILDTKTGYPVENELYSVTIISNSSEAGDALSTTTFALGVDKGLSLINNIEKTEAIFITNENKIILTDGLEINEDNEISFIEIPKDK